MDIFIVRSIIFNAVHFDGFGCCCSCFFNIGSTRLHYFAYFLQNGEAHFLALNDWLMCVGNNSKDKRNQINSKYGRKKNAQQHYTNLKENWLKKCVFKWFFFLHCIGPVTCEYHMKKIFIVPFDSNATLLLSLLHLLFLSSYVRLDYEINWHRCRFVKQATMWNKWKRNSYLQMMSYMAMC